MFELIQNDILKRMRLTDMELIADLSAAGDKSYLAEISTWVNSIRNEIATDNLLQCTQQGVGGVMGSEKGKILQFIDDGLTECCKIFGQQWIEGSQFGDIGTGHKRFVS